LAQATLAQARVEPVSAIKQRMAKEPAAALAIFRSWDLNGDGAITRFELRTALGARGIREAIADEAFDAMDFKEDDGVDFEEFAAWLRNAPVWAFVTLDFVASTLDDGSACGVVFRGGAHVGPALAHGVPHPVLNIGGEGYMEVPCQEPFSDEFTAYCWVRRQRKSPTELDCVLLGDNGSQWFLLDSAGHIGVAQNVAKPVFSEIPVMADESWAFIAIEASAKQTVLYAATATLPAPDEVAAAPLSLAGSRLQFVGRTQSRLQISEVKVFSRKLSLDDLHSIFVGSASRHGIVPGKPQLPAVPACAVRGHVRCGDAALSGVCVQGEGAIRDAFTDHAGYFALELAEPDIFTGTLTFRKPGFAGCSMGCAAKRGADIGEVQIRRIDVRAQLNAHEGGRLTDSKTGSSATLPPDCLCHLDGRAFAGVVSLELAVIDAADPAALAAMPGDFTAEMADADGSPTILQSLGAMYVGMQDETGEELVCKPGEGLVLEMHTGPLNFNPINALAAPCVYAFNDATGKWVERPDATLEVNGQEPSDAAAEGEEEEPLIAWTKEKFEEAFKSGAQVTMKGVDRQGWWNCDAPYLACLLRGHFGNADTCAGGVVWSVGIDYQGRARSVVDADGSFGVMAQCRSQVMLEVGLVAGDALRAHRENLAEHQWLQGRRRLTEGERTRLQELTRQLSAVTPKARITLGPFSTSEPGETCDLGEVVHASM